MKEETCYLCRRTKRDVQSLVKDEVERIAQSSADQSAKLEKKVAATEAQITKLEAFVKRLRKDLTWDTVTREPEAMVDLIPGLKDVWDSLVATEAESEGRHNLSGQARLAIFRLRQEAQKTQGALAKLKEAQALRTSLPFEEYSVNLTVESYQLDESGEEVHPVDNTLTVKVLICPLCESFVTPRSE